jgi:hypothetical protein
VLYPPAFINHRQEITRRMYWRCCSLPRRTRTRRAGFQICWSWPARLFTALRQQIHIHAADSHPISVALDEDLYRLDHLQRGVWRRYAPSISGSITAQLAAGVQEKGHACSMRDDSDLF